MITDLNKHLLDADKPQQQRLFAFNNLKMSCRKGKICFRLLNIKHTFRVLEVLVFCYKKKNEYCFHSYKCWVCFLFLVHFTEASD